MRPRTMNSRKAPAAYAEAMRVQAQLLEDIAKAIGFDGESELPADCRQADWADVGTADAANRKLMDALSMLLNREPELEDIIDRANSNPNI